MAIRIVREPPEDTPKQTTCSTCKSTLEYTSADVKHNSDQRDGDFDTFNCPVCRNQITVPCTGNHWRHR